MGPSSLQSRKYLEYKRFSDGLFDRIPDMQNVQTFDDMKQWLNEFRSKKKQFEICGHLRQVYRETFYQQDEQDLGHDYAIKQCFNQAQSYNQNLELIENRIKELKVTKTTNALASAPIPVNKFLALPHLSPKITSAAYPENESISASPLSSISNPFPSSKKTKSTTDVYNWNWTTWKQHLR